MYKSSYKVISTPTSTSSFLRLSEEYKWEALSYDKKQNLSTSGLQSYRNPLVNSSISN